MKQKIEMPCMNVKLVPRDSVAANNYNPNHVPKDKMELLKQSILDNGFCYPIVTIWSAEDERYVIIDGFHRYTICAPEWLDIDPVPVVVLPHNLAQRMAATVQFNKARGVHEVDLDADIVKSLLQQGMSELDVAKHLGLDIDTVYRYKQVSGVLELFANVDYSTSWEAARDGEAVAVGEEEDKAQAAPRWEYGGAYKRHDMHGVIECGTGKVQVHDLFDGLPEFMLGADCVFTDPPCSTGNLRSFYTKADMPDARGTYEEFLAALFSAIDAIRPKWLYIEVFAGNRAAVEAECRKRYAEVEVDESGYYHKAANRCWIVRCGGAPRPPAKLDEEDYIAWVCANVPFGRIADPCMGRGLVGYHANLNGKPFVGTELNTKRLAVLLDRIATGPSSKLSRAPQRPATA